MARYLSLKAPAPVTAYNKTTADGKLKPFVEPANSFVATA